MTSEVRPMIRSAIGGALLVGIEPVVFLVCGVYAGVVYGGIVGALAGARDERLEREPVSAAITQRGLVVATAVARSRAR